MAIVEIRLFGSLSLVSEGKNELSLPGRKARDLLSYLVLKHDVPLSREHLTDLFWGHRDEVHARRCFNTTLWRLQVAFGGKDSPAKRYLRSDAQTVSFCPSSAVSIDVVDFERCCELADGWPAEEVDHRAALHHQAVSMYRDDLLSDCYESWCVADRERLQRLYVRALRRLVQYHRQRGEIDVAIADARRILVCDPLREEVHRALIRLHLDSGDPTAALLQYQACSEMLKRELGIAPMPETSQLVQSLMRANPRVEAHRSVSAPLPSTRNEAGSRLAETDPHASGRDVMLQVCRQLRDVAVTLESVAARVSVPRPLAIEDAGALPIDHEYRQLLAELSARLGPVAAALHQAAGAGRPLPKTAHSSQPSEPRALRVHAG
jgi:DNA-binding SARP family transcriptional activator